jgi:hypothetical protein
MRPIPLSIQTLYADLLQTTELADVRPAAVFQRTIAGSDYLYANERDGGTKPQRYLGPAKDPEVQRAAAAIRRAAVQARDRRKSGAAIKAARVPAPDNHTGKILDVMANAGLFDSGAVLVGTIAYQLLASSAPICRPVVSKQMTLTSR